MGVLSLSKSATAWALDTSEIFLLIFGLILAIGVIGEYSRSPKWKARLRAFELMVMFGIAGELIADGGVFLFSRQLQTISDIEEARLRRETGDANEKAGEANERAAANEKKAAWLANQNLALQDQVLRLRLKMADRHLTPEQQSRIAKSLCGFGGVYIDIGLYNSDSESQELGKEIDGALPERCDGKPGFVVSIVQKLATIGFSGIQIIAKEGTSQKSKSLAAALAAALKQEGLQVRGPMAEPKRGNVMSGGSQFNRSIGAGIERATPVEIAIGKKP
jgi:hypothetical protein